MRSGSVVVQNEDGKKKYNIYVEDYVLSYLRREADSLELSEIYFYGSRQDGGRKLFVYGAGRDREIEAFAQYEPLSELVCRLTQAGPVFMVREPSGECNVNGFQIFYENNEAMQSYLLEWTGSADKQKDGEKSSGRETELPVLISPEEKPKKENYGAISVQLCLILMVLTAIVITSTDSYDKMRQLNQSAKEVFFAIENQEAEENAGDFENAEKRDEIIVERDMTTGYEAVEKNGDAESAEEAGSTTSEGSADADTDQTEDFSETEDKPEEGDLKPLTDGLSEESTDQKQDTVSDEEEEDEDSTETEEEPEEGEEALSRSITRYYEVEQGDTLYTISQKIYGDLSRVEKICEMNEITDPDKIRSGQRIILP